MHPLVVFMLLACVLSAAYVLRPEEQGTGNPYQALSLLRRTDALQQQQKQQLQDTVKCKMLHSRDSQHGSIDATTICAERSRDGSQQQVTIWSMHSVSSQDGDSSSSYAYAQSSEGAEYGHRRRRVVHRKLLHLAPRQ